MIDVQNGPARSQHHNFHLSVLRERGVSELGTRSVHLVRFMACALLSLVSMSG